MGYIEFVFFLSPMNLDELYLDLSSSQLFFSGYHFDLSKKYYENPTGKCLTSKQLIIIKKLLIF